jgi:serine/threonine-protein kinase
MMNGEWTSSVKHDADTDRVLGRRYRLISRLGVGGMAVVWKAHDSVLARTVAVKILGARYADDPESWDRIRREARASAALSHPNIAQVYDYGEADVASGGVIPFVVMELIPGDTLEQRLTAGPVPPRQAMRIGAEIGAALAAAHGQGLVHRDIKPANIMLSPTGAKVVDFGIAAAIRSQGSGMDKFEVLGTPAYVAPERLLYDTVEPASDVYALGVLLYRLLAGHSPWTIETTTQMLAAHVYVEPAPLLPMSQVPDYVTAACNRCLAKDPTERPSAREVAALLTHGAGVRTTVDASTPDEPAAAAPGDTSPPAGLQPDPAPPSGADRDQTDPTSAKEEIGSSPPAPSASGLEGPAPRRGRQPAVTLTLLAASSLVLAGVVALALRPEHDNAEGSPPIVETTTSAASTPTPPGSTRPTLAAPAGPRPAPAVSTAVVGPTPRPAIPGVPAGASPTPSGAGATTPAPPPPPPERTLRSAAGSVRATCPAATTAQILSWTATKPYKVAAGDNQPGPAPAVSFKHGATELTMTVTCAGGVPSATDT